MSKSVDLLPVPMGMLGNGKVGGNEKARLELIRSSLAHDLGAPARHVEGFCDLLLENESDPLRRDYLLRIKSAAVKWTALQQHLLAVCQA